MFVYVVPGLDAHALRTFLSSPEERRAKFVRFSGSFAEIEVNGRKEYVPSAHCFNVKTKGLFTLLKKTADCFENRRQKFTEELMQLSNKFGFRESSEPQKLVAVYFLEPEPSGISKIRFLSGTFSVRGYSVTHHETGEVFYTYTLFRDTPEFSEKIRVFREEMQKLHQEEFLHLQSLSAALILGDKK